MAHQIHWVKGFGPSRAAVLETFRRQVEQTGHVDNWFSWELSLSPGAGVEVREQEEVDLPRVTSLWAGEQAWVRAAWAEVRSYFGLGGPRAVCLAPVYPNEPEEVTALLVEAGSEPIVTLFQLTLARPLVIPPGAYAAGFTSLHEGAQELRRATLEWLEKHDVSTAPFLRGVAPDDWPAHLVGIPSDGPAHYLAIDMHH